MGAFLLVNTALGAGILNYPAAYDRLGGIYWASFVQLVSVWILEFFGCLKSSFSP